jgi:hypothetical protein
MVQRTGSQDGNKVLFIQNNFYYDAFFLKAIGASVFLFDQDAISYLRISLQF